MNLLSDPIWIPLSHRFLNSVAIGSVVLAVLFVVFWFQWRKGVALWLLRLREKLGLTELNPWLVGGLGLVWALLFAVFMLAMFWVVIGILGRVGAATPEEGTDLRWSLLTLTAMTASLGAVISLPFTLIRVTLNRRQTETAEQGMITDRINKAVEGLGAEKEISFHRHDSKGNPTYEKDGKGNNDYSKPTIVRETRPNLEVRIGAIYALDRIAQDSDRDHVQIIEILCAYIRENSPVSTARKSPHEVFEELTTGTEDDPPLNDEAAFQDERYRSVNVYGWAPTDLTPTNFERWANGLPRLRQDVQTALAVIGRRMPDQEQLEKSKRYNGEQPFRVDLSYTSLQRANLAGLFFGNALFRGSNLQGAYIQGACFDGANFRRANLDAISFFNVSFRNCYFRGTRMPIKQLLKMECLDGSILRDFDLRDAKIDKSKLNRVFADNSVDIDQPIPGHWITEDLPWLKVVERWEMWKLSKS